jgi:hypothetical protein
MMKYPACLLLLMSVLVAQPKGGERGPRRLASGSDLAFSSREDVSRGAVRVGSVAAQHENFSFSQRIALSAADTLVAGLSYGRLDLDTSAGMPLPGTLEELAVRLAWERILAPGWFTVVSARPGFSGDRLKGESFNVPVLLLGGLAASRQLVWTFGLNANALSRRPVLPVAGVRWEFTPGWTFAVMYPRVGFTWRARSGLTWQAGLHIDGGGYRVTQNLGVPAPGIARLANTRLDVRELRAGVGAEWELGNGFSIGLEAGVVTDRKFDFQDRNYRLDTNGGPFAALSFKGAF